MSRIIYCFLMLCSGRLNPQIMFHYVKVKLGVNKMMYWIQRVSYSLIRLDNKSVEGETKETFCCSVIKKETLAHNVLSFLISVTTLQSRQPTTVLIDKHLRSFIQAHPYNRTTCKANIKL